MPSATRLAKTKVELSANEHVALLDIKWFIMTGTGAKMPQLDDIKIFAAVVEAGGFRPAAQQIGFPASTISDVVRRLEDELGVRLLQRSTRSVMPTDAGRTLFNAIRPAFELIDRTVESLLGNADQTSGRLRLTVPEVVARYVLPNLLGRFMSAFPRIDVEISTDNTVIDIVDAGFDAAIRYKDRVARNMVAVPIGPTVQRFITAAAPTYLARHGSPREPKQLSAHRLIGHRLPTGAPVAWQFARGRRRERVIPSCTLVTPSIDLRIAAAVGGVGLINTFGEVLRPLIDQGVLSVVLEDWSPAFAGPILCYHGDRHMPMPLRAFVDFIRTDAGR